MSAEQTDKSIRDLVEEIRRLWDHPGVGPPPGVDSETLSALGRLVAIWDELTAVVTGWHSQWESSLAEAVPPLPHDGEARNVMGRVSKTADSARTALLDLLLVLRREVEPDQQVIDLLLGALATSARRYLDAAADFFSGRLPGHAQAIEKQKEGLRRAIQAEADLNDIEQVARRVRRTATQVEVQLDRSRTAAGEVGSLSVSMHFEAYRKSQHRAANLLRGSAVALVLGTAALLYLLPHDGLSVGELGQRALLTVSLLGLAGYLAAEAGRHRRAYQWAATLAVQLRTVDAYCAPLSAQEAADVRRSLGLRAFGDVPMIVDGAGKSENEDATITPMGLQALLDRVLAELRVRDSKPGPSGL